jgi:phage terminase Nu1 subunit (DNA packaging protein)
MITNRAGLADIVGCALGTVDAHVRDGMPAQKHGREWQFDTAQCIRWLRDRDRAITPASEMQDAELRERRARAGLREIELAERSKAMVHVSDLSMLMSEQFSIIKSQLDVLPARLAHRVADEADEAEVRRIIRDEVHQTYRNMNAEALTARLSNGDTR